MLSSGKKLPVISGSQTSICRCLIWSIAYLRTVGTLYLFNYLSGKIY